MKIPPFEEFTQNIVMGRNEEIVRRALGLEDGEESSIQAMNVTELVGKIISASHSMTLDLLSLYHQWLSETLESELQNQK